jgi:Fe-S-cluster containining protein
MRYAWGMASQYTSTPKTTSRRLPASDSSLIQIVDSALADATERSGEWLVCRPGCTQCCVGVFAINSLDAQRLKRGMDVLQKADPERADRIRERARRSIQTLSGRFPGKFPGNAKTGLLDEEIFAVGSEAEERFADLGNHEMCPVLDPKTGLCELYDSRPMTCRTFGPPVRSDGGLGVCELCFHGATDQQIADCEMVPDPENMEATLLNKLEAHGLRGHTVVAYCVK